MLCLTVAGSIVFLSPYFDKFKLLMRRKFMVSLPHNQSKKFHPPASEGGRTASFSVFLEHNTVKIHDVIQICTLVQVYSMTSTTFQIEVHYNLSTVGVKSVKIQWNFYPVLSIL